MLPLLRMLELMNLSLADAEAAGFNRLAEARGRNGRAPQCLNASYLEEVRKRSRPA